MSYPSNTVSSDAVAQDQLRAFIERIERMEEEKKAIADDIREIYAEAKGNGFDTKVLRKIVAIRKQDHAERMEQEALLDLYMGALGMQPRLPLDDDDDEPPPRPTREERRKDRFSESMDDAKALSAEAAALGLIDPAAHAETERLTDALASKFGNGPITDSVVPPAADRATEATPPASVATHEPVAAADTTGDYLREPMAAASGQILREGDAPLEAGAHATGEVLTGQGEHSESDFNSVATTEPAAGATPASGRPNSSPMLGADTGETVSTPVSPVAIAVTAGGVSIEHHGAVA